MSELKRAVLASAVGGLERPEPGAAVRRYRFDSEFVGFSGHFPGYAILPAIVQILAALAVVEEACGEPLELAGIENAKFLIQVRPGQELLVECRERRRAQEAVWQAKLFAAGGLAASFAMRVAARGAAG